MANSIQGGGQSLFKLIPVRSDGKTRDWGEGDHDIVGCHSGDYSGLNVVNPQPGMHYQWVRSDPKSIMIQRGHGGTPVTKDDEAFPAYELGFMSEDESDFPTPLDTGSCYGDVVLFQYPEERIRRRQEQAQRRAEQSLAGAEQQFLEGASAAELNSAQGQQTRFARRDHTTQMIGDTGAVAWSQNPERKNYEE